MKKILFLLITSILVISCGITGEEPNKPNNSENSDIIYPNEDVPNNEPVVKPEDVPNNEPAVKPEEDEEICKDGRVRIFNKSLSNTYKCYINDICIATIEPQKNYLYTAYCSAGHTLHMDVEEKSKKHDPFTFNPSYYSIELKPNVINVLNIPRLAPLYIKNSSNDTYSVSINDGLFYFQLKPNVTYTVENLDIHATYKISVVQLNGYFFYPTKKTYNYTMTDLMQNVFSFNP